MSDDLGNALRAAVPDEPGPDLTETSWVEGTRRRRQRRVVLGTAGLGLAAVVAAGGIGLANLRGDDTTTAGPGAGSTTTGTSTPSPGNRSRQVKQITGGTMDGYRVWKDQRLISPPAHAPAGHTWAILVLERADGSPVPTDVAHLAGTSWTQVPNGTYPWTGRARRLQLTADLLSGTGGCNAVSTEYTVEGDRLRSRQPAMTQMACEDDQLMKSDMLIAVLLEKQPTIVLGDDGRLYLAGWVNTRDVPAGWRSDNRLGPVEQSTGPLGPRATNGPKSTTWTPYPGPNGELPTGSPTP